MTRLFVPPLAVAMLSMLTAAAAGGHPGELKTYKDWTVGCDNVNRCTLASLGPEDGPFPAMVMSITRDAGAAGGWQIILTPVDGTAAAAGVWIDGKKVGGPFTPQGTGMAATGATADPIVALLANSKQLTLGDASGKRLAAISPIGLAAALRYVDAAQGRVGTVTAIVAKGDKPASAVPAPLPLPLIVAVKPSGRASLPTAAQTNALRRSAKCETSGLPDDKAEAYALGPEKALVLVPCSAGAYNFSSAVFVIDKGKPAPASFDAPTGFGARALVPMTVNAGYAAGTLTTYTKARGLGDCGVTQSFVWDGTRFRLSEQTEMGVCRGNSNYITTWRAKVVRR